MPMALDHRFWSKGIRPTSTGVSTLARGVPTLARGVSTLARGVSTPATHLNFIARGVSTLARGVSTLATRGLNFSNRGLNFSNDGISTGPQLDLNWTSNLSQLDLKFISTTDPPPLRPVTLAASPRRSMRRSNTDRGISQTENSVTDPGGIQQSSQAIERNQLHPDSSSAKFFICSRVHNGP